MEIKSYDLQPRDKVKLDYKSCRSFIKKSYDIFVTFIFILFKHILFIIFILYLLFSSYFIKFSLAERSITKVLGELYKH